MCVNEKRKKEKSLALPGGLRNLTTGQKGNPGGETHSGEPETAIKPDGAFKTLGTLRPALQSATCSHHANKGYKQTQAKICTQSMDVKLGKLHVPGSQEQT